MIQNMKKMIAAASLLMLGFAAQAQTSKATFKVYGNCGMCENRVEKAAVKAGATEASWNEDTKEMTVAFDASKTSQEKIEKAIAAVGHDTANQTAPKGLYEKLPGCCQYDRKAAAAPAPHKH